MEKIIDPVPLELIQKELTDDKLLRETNKGGNLLYVIDCNSAPNTLKEIGRLREITYRAAGGCSGKAADLDEYDYLKNPYQQLIVWDPDVKAIIGGYRFLYGKDAQFKENGQPRISSSALFRYSDVFIKDYLPHSIELGRSFVRPEYQSSISGAKALFAMDNLWDGIAAIMLSKPGTQYLFGKMTFYKSYDTSALHLILHFLDKHFKDTENLVTPYLPIKTSADKRLLNLILKEDNLRADYRCLKSAVRHLGTGIPPLVNSYINISSSMKIFGSALETDFSDAIDTGLMIDFRDIYPEKLNRHISSFVRRGKRNITLKARHTVDIK